jgi:hypothetical protein
MNNKEVKMTEQQWIAKMKKAGFELYKTKDLKPKLDAYEKAKNILNKATKH